MQSLKFNSVIWIGTKLVDAQEIYIEVADNDMGITKYLTAPILALFLVGTTRHSSKITIS
ncbi:MULTISPECIES: hypothetical protein [unclassified Microcoleus]|uniref:hypothetical protein n=1 Tax=unclassified Microcoleus TaxID=2642155 RepID=UPI002FD00C18